MESTQAETDVYDGLLPTKVTYISNTNGHSAIAPVTPEVFRASASFPNALAPKLTCCA